MNKKWVDNEVYFGPDRRKRDGGKRWGDRRHVNDAGEAPPLGALLRRLRVMITDADDAHRRGRMLQILGLAISESDRQHIRGCSERLLEIQRLIAANAKDTTVRVDQLLAEAITISQAPRDLY